MLEQYAELEATGQGGAGEGGRRGPERRSTPWVWQTWANSSSASIPTATARCASVYLHPDRVVECVLDGTAATGLLLYPRKSSKLVALPWREEEMVLACPPQHALASHSVLRLEALAGQAYVHFDKNLTIRRIVDRFLEESRGRRRGGLRVRQY